MPDSFDLSQFIGLDYCELGRGPLFDCWGLVAAALFQVFGVRVPSYRYATEDVGISMLAHRSEWLQVPVPEPGDVVLFVVRGRPAHVGLVVGSGRMLHVSRGTQSRIERYTTPLWRGRIEGFYRWAEPIA